MLFYLDLLVHQFDPRHDLLCRGEVRGGFIRCFYALKERGAIEVVIFEDI